MQRNTWSILLEKQITKMSTSLNCDMQFPMSNCENSIGEDATAISYIICISSGALPDYGHQGIMETFILTAAVHWWHETPMGKNFKMAITRWTWKMKLSWWNLPIQVMITIIYALIDLWRLCWIPISETRYEIIFVKATNSKSTDNRWRLERPVTLINLLGGTRSTVSSLGNHIFDIELEPNLAWS